MRRTLAALAAPITVLLLLTGCTQDPDGASGSAGPTASSTPGPTGSTEPSPSETQEPTGPPAPDMCTTLTAEAVGAVLGEAVERVALADSGCRYASTSDPSASSLGLVQGPVEQLGGLEGARAGISAVIEGKVEQVEIRDGGFLVVGQSFGGTTLSGGGAVQLGDSVVQITLLPGDGATPDQTRRLTEELLRLVARTIGD